MRRIHFLVLLAVAISGCTCRRIEEEPAQIHPVRTNEVVIHESGFAFPPSIDGFHRTEVHNYDESGKDMSFGYNDDKLLIIATVYVYPISSAEPRSTLEQHINDLRRVIVEDHPRAKSTKPASGSMMLSGVKRSGLAVTFDYREPYANQLRDLHGELFLFRHGANFVKYRFTYPVSNAGQCVKATRSLMRQIAWPKSGN